MSHPNPLGSNPPAGGPPWCTCGCDEKKPMIWNPLTEEHENPPASPIHESTPPSPSRVTPDIHTPSETVDPAHPGLGQHRNRGLGGLGGMGGLGIPPSPPLLTSTLYGLPVTTNPAFTGPHQHYLCGPDCSIDSTLGRPQMGGLGGIGGMTLGHHYNAGLGGLGGSTLGRSQMGGLGGMGGMGVMGDAPGAFGFASYERSWRHADLASEGLGRREDGSLHLFTPEEVLEMSERRRKQVEDLLALKLEGATDDEEAAK